MSLLFLIPSFGSHGTGIAQLDNVYFSYVFLNKNTYNKYKTSYQQLQHQSPSFDSHSTGIAQLDNVYFSYVFLNKNT